MLDCQDKDGEYVESDEDDEDYGEEGEFDQAGDLLDQLDEDTKERLKKGLVTPEELQALGLGDGLFEPGEGGEDELDEEPEESKDEEKKE